MFGALSIAMILAVGQGTPTDEARTLTRRSILEYDTGAYAQALVDIEHAYELAPRPELLFNVAQCQRVLGHHREAALAYKSYLRALPTARNRAAVQKLLAEMTRLQQQDEAVARAQPSPAPSPSPTAPVLVLATGPESTARAPQPAAPDAALSAQPEGRHIRSGAWWLGGSGLGVAIVGGVLFGVAEATLGGDHKTSLGNGAVEHSLSASSVSTANAEGNTGEVLWAVGGALLVAGIVVAFTGGSP